MKIGDSGALQTELKQIITICSNRFAFVVKLKDGRVVVWGNVVCGYVASLLFIKY